MKKSNEIGHELCMMIWDSINEFPELWDKTDDETKKKLVNRTGEIAVKLVSEAYVNNEIALPVNVVRKYALLTVIQFIGYFATGWMIMDILSFF